jgi:hypothetical protein
MVDEQARAAEREIDTAYTQHPLLNYPYGESLTATLIATNALLEAFAKTTAMEYCVAVDTLINALKHAVFWLWNSRFRQRLVEPTGDPVQHAKSFVLLAVEYLGMETAYKHAGFGLVDLTCEGETLKVSGALLEEQQYEAYNELIKTSIQVTAEDAEVARTSGEGLMAAITGAGLRGVPIDRVPLDGRVLSVSYKAMADRAAKAHLLPNEWRFGRFSLRSFRAVHSVLCAVLYTWNRLAPVLAREPWFIPYAAHRPFVMTRSEILSAASDAGGVTKAETRSVLDLLEYGAAGISHPDPALQPLLALPDGRYLLSEPLILSGAAERNLAVLLNRIPDEKKRYSRLTNQKEVEMRTRLCHRLGSHFNVWHGSIDGHEVDLAVIDPTDQSLLLLELKWFIEPAETRELKDRSEELSKGINQCKKLLQLAPSAFNKLPGAPFRTVGAAVVSANWSGFGNIQDGEVPILTEEHVVRKLQVSSSLTEVIQWLGSRSYLPIKGRDFAAIERPSKVGRWTLEWYRIQRLRDDFMPL